VPEKMVKVESKCPRCHKVDHFEVTAKGLANRRKSVPLNEAFPELDPARLVQLSTHVCPACQEKEREGVA
jgi:hypothetical protein